MLIRVGYRIAFRFPNDVPMVVLLFLHRSRLASLRTPEQFRITPDVPVARFNDLHGNRCARFVAPSGRLVLRSDAIVEDSGLPDPQDWDATENPVDLLPLETLPYLLPSRYCEVDSELQDFAWTHFSDTAPGWARVRAICDFVHDYVRFDYLKARPNRTALETYRERVGVCRDYVHLAVTLCRCLNIPARYASGYLGDIGIPPEPYPMDFNAWFEAYLGDAWYAFDPRHNVPRIGRVLMAHGRDAADCSLSTSFGGNYLDHFEVWTHEVPELPKTNAPARSEELAATLVN